MSSNVRGLAGTLDVNFRPGQRPSAAMFERVCRLVLGARGTGDASVRFRPSGLEIVVPRGREKAGETIPWEKFLFGYEITANVITVLPGEVHFRDQIYTSPETALLISADLTYVYVQMEWGTGLCSILSSTTKTDATATDTYFRKWLYLLNYTAPATIVIKTYGHVGGAISIAPVFA